MAQNISLMGASYPNVPSVRLPKTGGGQATFVDVTGATLSSSDGNKVLTGQTAYGNDGNKIIGTMPDFSTFPLFCQSMSVQIITCSSSTQRLNLPATDLGGRPISFLFASVYGATPLSDISTAGSNLTYSFLTGAYTKDYRFVNSSGAARQTYYLAARPVYSSWSAHVSYDVTAAAGRFTIENESALASGGAYILLSNGYFRSGATYEVLIGG